MPGEIRLEQSVASFLEGAVENRRQTCGPDASGLSANPEYERDLSASATLRWHTERNEFQQHRNFAIIVA